MRGVIAVPKPSGNQPMKKKTAKKVAKKTAKKVAKKSQGGYGG